MKFILIGLFVLFSSFSYTNAETVKKGDYLEWAYFKDSQAYINGDFISWNEKEYDNYEFNQHFIWTNEELNTAMAKAQFNNDEINSFYNAYTYNWDGGDTVHNGTSIDKSASLFELSNTCMVSDITEKKCNDFYLEAYKIAVKNFNEQSSQEYKTYNTYGPLNLPITVLVWNMFKADRKCRIGEVIPEFAIQNNKEVKIVTKDNIATCSYSEKTQKYKCILNRFYNTPYRCMVSCEGTFSAQGNNLVFDGYCSDQSIVRNSRPTFDTSVAYYRLTHFKEKCNTSFMRSTCDIVNEYFKQTNNKNYVEPGGY